MAEAQLILIRCQTYGTCAERRSACCEHAHTAGHVAVIYQPREYAVEFDKLPVAEGHPAPLKAGRRFDVCRVVVGVEAT
jgi:hypothetical protein